MRKANESPTTAVSGRLLRSCCATFGLRDMTLDPSARLVYEAIQQLGWDADPARLTERIQALDIGLPAEDEFACLLTWFGRCRLVHGLSQSQHPPTSRETLQVPDLLAVFDAPGGHGTCTALIEVKTSKTRKLSWTQKYMAKLRGYADLLGVPLLVAWRCLSLWTLVDIKAFQKRDRNWHLPLEEALRQNMMGMLAGDFAFVMRGNVGLHLELKKEHLIAETQRSPTEREETWNLRVTDAFFINSFGDRMTCLRRGLWPLFLSAGPESANEVRESSIHQQFCIPEEPGIHFAHAALPVLIAFSGAEKTRVEWRKQLEHGDFPVQFDDISRAATEGIKDGFVQHVLHQQPVTKPTFLEKKDRTSA